jgi:MtN3 and saliva related transmembrane protein
MHHMHQWLDWFGALGAFCTTVAFVPQVAKIWRTKSTKDISLPMYLVFSAGVVCWFVYGVLLWAWPIMVANAFTIVLAGAVVVMKLRWG